MRLAGERNDLPRDHERDRRGEYGADDDGAQDVVHGFRLPCGNHEDDGYADAGENRRDKIHVVGTPNELPQAAIDASAARGIPLTDIYYGAESVLLPEYRGQGIGHRFFDLREAFARSLGRKWLAFCSVTRPDDHPLRPATYRTNDAFWRGRGYAPLPGVQAEFAWKDVGEAAETVKRLQFWMRRL